MEQSTPALDALEGSGIPYDVIRTERATSAEESAQFQGIEPHQLLRSLVVRRGENDYIFVLVPTGRSIDWPKLRGHLGVSRLSLPDKDEAKAATGYERGAITPFGSSTAWPVIVDDSVDTAETIAVGGGGHGWNLHIKAADLIAHLGAETVDVTKIDEPRTRPQMKASPTV